MAHKPKDAIYQNDEVLSDCVTEAGIAIPDIRMCVKLIFTQSGSNTIFITLKPLRLRCLTGAACAVLKKFPSDFFNPAFGVTTPQEAPYETTGNSVEVLL